MEEIDGFYFKIGAKSFFQTNSEQAKVLYRRTKELAQIKKDNIVYDLYTGTGTIAGTFTGNLTGDVTGSGTVTNLGNVSISTTVAANSVALGTDTTGNFVADLTAGEGIDVSGGGSENATITVSAEDATSSNKGIASPTCVIGSGGVKIAPKIRKTTIANFRYSRKNAGVRIPIFVKNIDTTGSWNNKPHPNINQRMYTRYPSKVKL